MSLVRAQRSHLRRFLFGCVCGCAQGGIFYGASSLVVVEMGLMFVVTGFLAAKVGITSTGSLYTAQAGNVRENMWKICVGDVCDPKGVENSEDAQIIRHFQTITDPLAWTIVEFILSGLTLILLQGLVIRRCSKGFVKAPWSNVARTYTIWALLLAAAFFLAISTQIAVQAVFWQKNYKSRIDIGWLQFSFSIAEAGLALLAIFFMIMDLKVNTVPHGAGILRNITPKFATKTEIVPAVQKSVVQVA